MKLISLNLAIKMSNTQDIIRFLQQQDADIVATQEVVRHLDETVHETYRTKADIETVLGDQYSHVFFAPTWVGNAFKTPTEVTHDFGGHIEQGCEVLSKIPIAGGMNEFFYKHFEYMQDWSNWHTEDHGRALQITHFMIDGKPLQVLNLHGIWTADKMGDARTEAECRYIVEAAKRQDIATIIVGDFNLLPDSPSLRIVSERFRDLISEFNIKTTRPAFQDDIEQGGQVIDYIFTSDHITVTDFSVPQVTVSDHLPLILDFEIN